jgi:serine/threonine protein kinase
VVTSDGHSIGPYRLVELLGRGGMGEVWLAEDATGAAGGAPRLVALKLIDPALAANPAVRARFAREAAALRRVASPFVAPLLDGDTDAEVPWLASAYVAGPTLADHVAQHGPLTEPALRALGAALAEALVAIHAAGVVHRDLTPRNVVLGPDGPRLVDFGIAWFPDAVPVTRAGTSVGTPAWMAPERLASGEATPSSDVWSWGKVMAYAAGPEPGRMPAWLGPWVQAATAVDPQARPTAVQLRAAMTLDADRTHVEEIQTDVQTVPDLGPTPLAPSPGRWLLRRRLVSLASAAAVIAAAAIVGALAGLLASVLVAAVLVLVALAVQYRRGDDSGRPRARPAVPPTWSIALASPVVLGAGLATTFGPLPGFIVTVVVVVLFILLTDLVT